MALRVDSDPQSARPRGAALAAGLRVLASLALALASLASLASLGPVLTSAQRRELPVPTAIEDPTGHALDAVREALARASSRRARIAFWGASHTASDQYTGVVRRRLEARFGGGGPGELAPARPFPLYDRSDVELAEATGWTGLSTRGHRVADHYGRAGFALEATGPARAIARPSASIARVELWAMAQPGGGTVGLEVDGARAEARTDGRRGELVRLALDVAPGQHAIAAVAAGDGPVRLFGVVAEDAGDRGVVVESFGVPGARARDALLWDAEGFVSQLAARPPDLFVLAYGTNESGERRAEPELEADMRALVARLRRGAPAASCLVMGPSDRPRLGPGGWAPSPRSAPVRDAFRRAALAEGCAFFDLLAFQGGPGSAGEWVARGWAIEDHVHLSDEGHRLVGEALARELTRGVPGR